MITKQDRDRRLKAIDADPDSNRREREKLAHSNAPLPAFSEWRRMTRPFENFARLSIDEKRLTLSRDQGEGRVRRQLVSADW
jgi:hypothetical protein